MFPQDIKKKTFTKTLKGYNPSEVDEYISYLLSKYSEACQEYAELEKKHQFALEKLELAKSEENMISATIVNAQKMADAIVADAKTKADDVRNTVSETCEKIIAAYVEKVASERDKLAKVEKAVIDFKESLYDAYKEHIALIDNIMPDEEPTPYLSNEELEEKAVELAQEQINSESKESADAEGENVSTEDTSEN